jgi:hypothetical protein
VFRTLKQLHIKTFFIAVEIMDKFLESISKHVGKLSENLYHLIGIASVILAIKFDEQDNYSIPELVQILSSNKFSSE